MPAQERIRRDQGPDLFQQLPAQDLRLDCQSPALVVVEQDAFLAKLLLEHLVFGAEVLDDLLLLAVDPAGKDEEEQLPGLEDEVHRGRLRQGCGTGRSRW